MHVVAVTDVVPAGHVLPAHAAPVAAHPAVAHLAPDAAHPAPAHAAVHHAAVHAGNPGRSDGHGSHEHDALLGCLIALTGLGLIASARRSSRWVRLRAAVVRAAASATSVITAPLTASRHTGQLQVLRI